MKREALSALPSSVLAAGSLTGCLSPIAMHRAVIEYDRTVHRVEAELLLLNIARARQYRPVLLTAVSSVAATFDFASMPASSDGFPEAPYQTIRS